MGATALALILAQIFALAIQFPETNALLCLAVFFLATLLGNAGNLEDEDPIRADLTRLRRAWATHTRGRHGGRSDLRWWVKRSHGSSRG